MPLWYLKDTEYLHMHIRKTYKQLIIFASFGLDIFPISVTFNETRIFVQSVLF